MADISTILAMSEQVTIMDQRLVGQTISRNQRISTAEIVTVIPFQFTFKPNSYQLYSQNRNLLANLRYYDKSLEQYLNFGSTGWVNYIAYQGDMTPSQIASCQWQTASANKTLVLGNLPSITSTKYIVKAGDFIQIAGFPYPFTVVNDVQRGNGSTITVTTHRPNFISSSVQNAGILVGNAVNFKVFCSNMPTYKLIPGATSVSGGQVINNAYILLISLKKSILS